MKKRIQRANFNFKIFFYRRAHTISMEKRERINIKYQNLITEKRKIEMQARPFFINVP